jgi:hypothetical protein
MPSLSCLLRAGSRRLVSRTVLAGLVAATAPVAFAYLPPGATVAPTTPATNVDSFPKRITPRGPGFGMWSSAAVTPFIGRGGYSASTSVRAGSGFLAGLMEFDSSGRAILRISALEERVYVESTGDASRMFAYKFETDAVSFGIFSTSGTNAPVFLHRIPSSPGARSTYVQRGNSPARVYVTSDLDTEVQVLVFSDDGTLDWGRRYSSLFFGQNAAGRPENQLQWADPLPDGGMIIAVAKYAASFPQPAEDNQIALVRLSAAGDIVWAKLIVGETDFFDVFSDPTSGSVYLEGLESPSGGQQSRILMKLTSAGALAWSRRLSANGYLYPVGELANGRLVVTNGFKRLALISPSGALESQIELPFGVAGGMETFIEGNRMWISTRSVSAESTTSGPVYVGLAEGDFSNLRWRQYANLMTYGRAIPDFDSDTVVAWFFKLSSSTLEVMTFRDDFSSSVNSALLPSDTVATTNPGITLSDAGYKVSNLTVKATAVTPTLQATTLKGFTSLPVTESAISTAGNFVPATISRQPASQAFNPGSFSAPTFTVQLANPESQPLSYQWSFNGAPISGAVGSSYTVPSTARPALVGTYTVAVTAGTTVLQSQPAFFELNATTRPVGDSVLFVPDIQHPNGNIYDQFLLTGAATTITADPGQVARISFVDANDDIVQVEYSGAGVLTLQLANATGPALAVSYNQPTVNYMKGTPTITITGADQTSNLGIFSVGSITGNPAVLKSGTTYDGFANVALINIASANGQFGGLRIGNAVLSGSSGNVGLVAAGVNFTGPIVIGDIDASGTASPKLLTGTVAGLTGFAGEIRIAGGDLLQTNSRAIEFGTATAVRMGAGTNAHGVALSVKPVAGRLERNGQNVTASVVVGP